MRAFIAIELPDKLKENVAEFQSKLKDIIRGTFVANKKLHLTLKFLGEISDKDVFKISKILGDLCKNYKVFTLSLKGIGAFPSKDYVRVLWVGTDKGSSEIKAIREDINIALDSKEKRDFAGHLTLARVKAVIDKKKLAELFTDRDFGSFEVKEIKLIESIPTKTKYIYKIIKEFKIKHK